MLAYRLPAEPDRGNRVEFLGQLTAYTHGPTVDEASNWFEEVAEE